MRNFYSERKYAKTEKNFKPNNLFRNFLIKENADHSSKHFVFKRREILPEYTNIRKKINKHIREVKSLYNIENTIFKEIKSKDVIAYNKFAKDMTMFFFGPKGAVTLKNKKLKKFYEKQNKHDKIGLNTKIYAGKWEYYEASTGNKVLGRLEINKQRKLKTSQNFTQEDDIAYKMHSLYLKRKVEKERNRRKEEETADDNHKTSRNYVQKSKKRHSLISDINQISKYNENFFKTSIEPYRNNKKDSTKNIMNSLNSLRSNHKHSSSINKLPDILKEHKYYYNNTDSPKKSKTVNRSPNLNRIKRIKDIVKRERLIEKLRNEKKNHFNKLRLNLSIKLNSIVEPSYILLQSMNLIKKNNETNFHYRNNKIKYKEDIKVIGEDDKKEKTDNMNKFVKTNYTNRRHNDTKGVPSKIYFSYYDQSKSKIHKSVKEFVRNIWKMKEEEREKKYFKNIRVKFNANRKLIEQLGVSLDNAKKKSKKREDKKNLL